MRPAVAGKGLGVEGEQLAAREQWRWRQEAICKFIDMCIINAAKVVMVVVVWGGGCPF